jgi:hypothetical protein
MVKATDCVIVYRKGEKLLFDKIIEALKNSNKTYVVGIIETHEGDKFCVIPLIGNWESKLMNELDGSPLVLIAINYSEVALTIAAASFESPRFAYREPDDDSWDPAAHH